ncbi:MAG: HD domain-containing protein [Micropruina sp.]
MFLLDRSYTVESTVPRLGFTRPAKRNPNWWIDIDGGQDVLRSAADAAVQALVYVYDIDPDDIADAVDVSLSERAALASLSSAERRATTAHEGQVDKAGRPYIEHPRRVADRVAEVDGRAAAGCVAWLHDVVEDGDVTLDELRDDFDDAIVDALTRRDGEGDDYYRRVAPNDLAVAVKRADIWDNTNPERLAALPASTRDRLQAKYAHALALLDQLAPPASDTPPETVGDRHDSLGMDAAAIGRLMAYAIQGYSFEEYLQSQNIPEAHRAEAAIYYQDTIETQKRAVAAGGAVYPISDW